MLPEVTELVPASPEKLLGDPKGVSAAANLLWSSEAFLSGLPKLRLSYKEPLVFGKDGW